MRFLSKLRSDSGILACKPIKEKKSTKKQGRISGILVSKKHMFARHGCVYYQPPRTKPKESCREGVGIRVAVGVSFGGE